MFSLFKKKSPIDKLYQEHEKLLKNAYALSSFNRAASDAKYAEAAALIKEIEDLKSSSSITS